MVRLFAIDCESLFQGPQHGLLDAFSPLEWNWQYRDSDQHPGDRFLLAMQGNDPRQDAALCLDACCDIVSRCHCDAAILGLSDHAHFGSVSWSELF
jgi:hypothetical protein